MGCGWLCGNTASFGVKFAISLYGSSMSSLPGRVACEGKNGCLPEQLLATELVRDIPILATSGDGIVGDIQSPIRHRRCHVREIYMIISNVRATGLQLVGTDIRALGIASVIPNRPHISLDVLLRACIESVPIQLHWLYYR